MAPVARDAVVDARLDLRVLAFTAGLSTIAALLFGIGPALRATRSDLAASLRTSSQRGGRVRSVASQALLAAEVAASLVLLVSAGLLLRTLYNFSRVDVGFNADNVLVFRMDPPPQGDGASRLFDTYDRIMASIESVPGVQSCTMSAMPLIAGASGKKPSSRMALASRGARSFRLRAGTSSRRWGFRWWRGGTSRRADREGRPRVAVINETMARDVFGERAPVGRYFQLVSGPGRNVPIQVIGIARDSKYARLEQQAPPTLFMPHAQLPASGMTVAVRTASDPLTLAAAIREAVARSDPGMALAEMKTERQQIAETIGKPRALAVLTAVSGTIGLLLACVGLYGVVSYETARRTQEIGIRMALGAGRADVLRLVMRQIVVVLAIGSAIGLALALAASRLIASLLFGIAPTDPLAIGSALAS